jgi:hypothetical protein
LMFLGTLSTNQTGWSRKSCASNRPGAADC